MPRRDRLRRVVLLCCSFARNLCYYRAGRTDDHLALVEPAMNRTASFWLQTQRNFIDICVLEWCKLFADKDGKHHWRRVVTSPRTFEEELLAKLELDKGIFQQQIDEIRRYRDKFVAHLDSAYTADIPFLDVHKQAVWHYHRHVVKNEAKPGELDGLPLSLDEGFRDCSIEADLVYQAARATGSVGDPRSCN